MLFYSVLVNTLKIQSFCFVKFGFCCFPVLVCSDGIPCLSDFFNIIYVFPEWFWVYYYASNYASLKVALRLLLAEIYHFCMSYSRIFDITSLSGMLISIFVSCIATMPGFSVCLDIKCSVPDFIDINGDNIELAFLLVVFLIGGIYVSDKTANVFVV